MSGRRHDGRGAFLGTQEIVQRLRATRPARFGGARRPLGGAVLVAAVGLVWGQVARHRLAGNTAPAAAPTVAVTSAAPTDQVAAATLQGAGEPDAAAENGEAPQFRLNVVVRGAPRGAELRIDGNAMGQASRWSGKLPRGPHAVAVRAKGLDHSYVVQLQSAQELVFELQKGRVHARSLHEHAHKGH